VFVGFDSLLGVKFRGEKGDYFFCTTLYHSLFWLFSADTSCGKQSRPPPYASRHACSRTDLPHVSIRRHQDCQGAQGFSWGGLGPADTALRQCLLQLGYAAFRYIGVHQSKMGELCELGQLLESRVRYFAATQARPGRPREHPPSSNGMAHDLVFFSTPPATTVRNKSPQRNQRVWRVSTLVWGATSRRQSPM